MAWRSFACFDCCPFVKDDSSFSNLRPTVMKTVAYSGGDCATAPLWSNREFLYNFCTVFVSFVLRLNRKIRVPRLLPVKNCVKVIMLGTKMFFFLGKGPAPPPCPPLDAYGTSPILTEILNTPLDKN